MGNCLPKISQYRKQFSWHGNHTKIGYPKVQRNCLPKIRISRIELYEMVTLASPTKLKDFTSSMGKTLYNSKKTRWNVPVPIRRKRYSHKQTQTCSYPPGTIKEHVAKKDSMNSSELWYSTVNHDVKHEVSVIDSHDQTEYAFVSVPKRKANVTSPEEHSVYDDVLVA